MSSSSSYTYFSGVTGVGNDPLFFLDFFFLNKPPKLPVLFVSFLGLLRDTDAEDTDAEEGFLRDTDAEDTDAEEGFLVDSGTEITLGAL
jgi:hypothetical protein